MKNVLQFIVLSFIFLIISNNNVFAQQDSVAQTTKDYWKLVYENDSNNNGLAKKLSDTEIHAIAKIFYDAYSNDPAGFQRYFLNEHNKWGDSLKKGYPIKNRRPGTLSGNAERIIAAKYGSKFVDIICAPYYLKVKIINDSSSWFTIMENSKTRQMNLICSVEEIIKGEKSLHIGQEITVSFLINWMVDDFESALPPKGEHAFMPGQSYFIPIKIWGQDENFSKLALNCYSDTYFPIYPIKDGIISTPGDFFGIGENTNWETFKKAFVQKYILK